MSHEARVDIRSETDSATASRRSSTRAGTWIGLLLLVAGAIALRLHGIGFLMPGQPEPDGVVYEKQVQILREGVHSQESQLLFAFYPHVVARLVAALPDPASGEPPARTRDEHVARASAARAQIRTVVAWLSLFAVPATWWLARRFVPDPWALLAAGFVAASVLLVWFSQQARPHAVLTSFATLSIVAALAVRERGGLRATLFAGLALGLAVGTLQNGLALALPFALALVLRARAERAGRGRLVVGAVAALVVLAACVRVFYPFHFSGARVGRIGTEASRMNVGGHVVDLKMFDGRGFATVARTAWEYDPVLTVLALVGVAFGLASLVVRWRERAAGAATPCAAGPAPRGPSSAGHVAIDAAERRLARDRIWIVLAFVVPYSIVIGLYARTYQRFCTPLVPFAAVAAAYAAWRLFTAARRHGRIAAAASATAIGGVCAFQAFAAWKLVHARAQVDTIREAAAWIEANVDPARKITVLPTIELPMLQSQLARNANRESNMDVRFPWFTYLWQLEPEAFAEQTWNTYTMPLATEPRRAAARADTAAFVASLQADYAVVEVFSRGRFPLLSAIRVELAKAGTLEARIVPDGVDRGEDLPFVYQDDEYPYTTPWFARTLGLRAVGPVIEIYKLNGAPAK